MELKHTLTKYQNFTSGLLKLLPVEVIADSDDFSDVDFYDF